MPKANPLKSVYAQLAKAGLSKAYVRKVGLPSWWDDEIASEPSGFTEAASHLARRLGLELTPLLKNGSVQWKDGRPVNFKCARGRKEEDVEVPRRIAVNALEVATAYTKTAWEGTSVNPQEIRHTILSSGQRVIRLENVLDYCWSRGLPVVHVHAFPSGTKKMDGLAAWCGERPAIAVSINRQSPAWMVFVVAHELAHVALGHVKSKGVIVDAKVSADDTDHEEQEANAFAVELLTGQRDAKFTAHVWLNGRALAESARSLGQRMQIDPGVIALNYAWQKQRFDVANAALLEIEGNASAIEMIRQRAVENLRWEDMTESDQELMEVVAGVAPSVPCRA